MGGEPTAAPADFVEPSGYVKSGGKLAVMNPDGSIGMIEPRDHAAASAQGLRPATFEEFDRDFRQTLCAKYFYEVN